MNIFTFTVIYIKYLYANSADPDQTPRVAAAELDLPFA